MIFGSRISSGFSSSKAPFLITAPERQRARFSRFPSSLTMAHRPDSLPRFTPPWRCPVRHHRVARSLDISDSEPSSSECSEQEFDLTLTSGDEESWPDDTVRQLSEGRPLKCSAVWRRTITPSSRHPTPLGFKSSLVMIVAYSAFFSPPTVGFITFGLSVSEGAFLIALRTNRARSP
ncbi:hypothetical protein CSUI_005185 [Cystoisospora suis]|uniref:Uncharacterized protein n=1 Tax=Cystoisospora suis TaxID=483139 RepID=A0A2C6KYJ0_9APIC|nr:hypothetical protein CSUI_005185 [Cystoisospora suis]